MIELLIARNIIFVQLFVDQSTMALVIVILLAVSKDLKGTCEGSSCYWLVARNPYKIPRQPHRIYVQC